MSEQAVPDGRVSLRIGYQEEEDVDLSRADPPDPAMCRLPPDCCHCAMQSTTTPGPSMS